jgi:hypothetical protein
MKQVLPHSFKKYPSGNFSIKVVCPYCAEFHKHGTTDLLSIGSRSADCSKGEYFVLPITDESVGDSLPNEFKKVLSRRD